MPTTKVTQELKGALRVYGRPRWLALPETETTKFEVLMDTFKFINLDGENHHHITNLEKGSGSSRR